ncbi:type II toxin-antitoxin system VapC family toxin [Pseudolysinimonas kribbensis]|uniref:Ribonuclease VapC n=1 Tax=Pseudolysinimonas kribbensis TaxID=433641 RepID=A0ABQ6K2K5_9MICO|nr:type II toxin-antitoxin system VapC family toxin [Pseudolysinimonas kribbensis]GMA94162.1 ribonuclease VapC [Pseudolysinimonas kribbensis]
MTRRVYFDTSAAMKLLHPEAHSADVARWVDDPQIEAVSSSLLETELRRGAARWEIRQEDATQVIDRFALYEHPGWEFKAAGLLPDRAARSLDAIHVAAALRVEAHALVTYDARMIAAASAMGLPVIRPGIDADASVAPAGIG